MIEDPASHPSGIGCALSGCDCTPAGCNSHHARDSPRAATSDNLRDVARRPCRIGQMDEPNPNIRKALSEQTSVKPQTVDYLDSWLRRWDRSPPEALREKQVMSVCSASALLHIIDIIGCPATAYVVFRVTDSLTSDRRVGDAAGVEGVGVDRTGSMMTRIPNPPGGVNAGIGGYDG